MNRRTRTLLVVGLALVMASIASLGVYLAIQRIPVREVEVAHYHVVVASRALPLGTMLTRDDVKVVAWPQSSRVPGGFETTDEVLGRGLVTSVVTNEPLTDSKLAPTEAGAGLPPTIRPGMRAMSVRVNDVIGVAGFVVPGTRVDVLVSVRESDTRMSRIVASNVQVLASGTRYDQEQAMGGDPMPTTVVTFMVTPEDAERIALASTEGRIMLALRNPLDTDPSVTHGIRLAQLLASPAPPQPAAAPAGPRPAPRPVAAAPPPPPSRIYTVEAIRAAQRTEETVR